MKKNKLFISLTIIIIVLVGIIGSYIFYDKMIQKDNNDDHLEETKIEVTTELINELQKSIPHSYYNVYKNSKDELINISISNIYGKVATSLNFKPTTETYYYTHGNYYLENCEIASVEEFKTSIQKRYNLNFDENEIKNDHLGDYEEASYYYLNDTIVRKKYEDSDIKNHMINKTIDYEIKDNDLIIYERIAFYKTLSYLESSNFTEEENKYVLSNMYNQKFYFSTEQELEQYFEDNIEYFTVYESTFKLIDNNYYWNSTEKIDNENELGNTLWISYIDNVPKDLTPNYSSGNDYYNGTNYYLSDIKVPYINIDTNDAKKANEEITALYEECLESYKEFALNSYPWHVTADYEYFTQEQMGSVIVTFSSGGTDVTLPHYLTYNFDLNSGSSLTYQEAYNLLGYTSDEIEQKVKNEITAILKEKLKNFKDPLKDTGDGGYYPEGTNFETYNNESINSYQNSINNNSIKYFVDDDNKLNIIATLSIPVGTGSFDTIIKID